MNQAISIAALLFVAISIGGFIRNPEKYGEIMRKFDEARYGTEVAE